MDRFELINIAREADCMDNDRLSDVAEAVCSGEVCGMAWKPAQIKAEMAEDSQNN